MIKLITGKFELTPLDAIGDVDLIILDPPDNINLKYSEFKDNKPIWEYEAGLKLWITLLSNFPDIPIFLTFNEKWTRIVENIIEEVGPPLIQRIQWYFNFGQDQTSRGKYALCHRPIYWLGSDYVNPKEIKIPSARQLKYGDKRAAKGGKMPPNIWEYPRICGTHKERRNWSPTQLPEALIERIIKGHCCPGGRVLDPFIGSGTTAVVCQRLGVDCVGIDISETTIQKTAEHLGVNYG